MVLKYIRDIMNKKLIILLMIAFVNNCFAMDDWINKYNKILEDNVDNIETYGLAESKNKRSKRYFKVARDFIRAYIFEDPIELDSFISDYDYYKRLKIKITTQEKDNVKSFYENKKVTLERIMLQEYKLVLKKLIKDLKDLFRTPTPVKEESKTLHINLANFIRHKKNKLVDNFLLYFDSEYSSDESKRNDEVNKYFTNLKTKKTEKKLTKEEFERAYISYKELEIERKLLKAFTKESWEILSKINNIDGFVKFLGKNAVLFSNYDDWMTIVEKVFSKLGVNTELYRKFLSLKYYYKAIDKNYMFVDFIKIENHVGQLKSENNIKNIKNIANLNVVFGADNNRFCAQVKIFKDKNNKNIDIGIVSDQNYFLSEDRVGIPKIIYLLDHLLGEEGFKVFKSYQESNSWLNRDVSLNGLDGINGNIEPYYLDFIGEGDTYEVEEGKKLCEPGQLIQLN